MIFIFLITSQISKESIYKTAIDIAKENDHQEIIKILIDQNK